MLQKHMKDLPKQRLVYMIKTIHWTSVFHLDKRTHTHTHNTRIISFFLAVKQLQITEQVSNGQKRDQVCCISSQDLPLITSCVHYLHSAQHKHGLKRTMQQNQQSAAPTADNTKTSEITTALTLDFIRVPTALKPGCCFKYIAHAALNLSVRSCEHKRQGQTHYAELQHVKIRRITYCAEIHWVAILSSKGALQ